MSDDRSEWMSSLRPGDTVTVTRYERAERGQRYATFTPQHAQVERVNTQHVTVLGQRFRISWAGGNSGHSTSGPHARLTPAADLPGLQLEVRLYAALNVLLPLERPETQHLDMVMQRVPHHESGVITPEIVEHLEAAVERQEAALAALRTLRTEVLAAAAQIDARAEDWWAAIARR